MESVLIGIVCVGMVIKLVGRQVFNTVLIMSILKGIGT